MWSPDAQRGRAASRPAILSPNIQRNVMAPAVSGTVHGFGMQAQWYF